MNCWETNKNKIICLIRLAFFLRLILFHILLCNKYKKINLIRWLIAVYIILTDVSNTSALKPNKLQVMLTEYSTASGFMYCEKENQECCYSSMVVSSLVWERLGLLVYQLYTGVRISCSAWPFHFLIQAIVLHITNMVGIMFEQELKSSGGFQDGTWWLIRNRTRHRE